MIPRFRPHYNWREIVAASSFWRQAAVQEFERRFAQKFGRRFAIAFPYGRTALIAQLRALGLKGKTILCPSYTCVVVAHAIMFSGNEPVFVDSQASDFNMDLNKLDGLVNQSTGAVIVTSIFGSPVNLKQLRAFSLRHPSVPIIQDCCHSYDCQWEGESVLNVGISGFFALNISKVINSIFGGMVLTDDERFAQRIYEERAMLLKPGSFRKSLLSAAYLIATLVAFWDKFYGLVLWISRQGILGRLVKYYDESVIDMPQDYLEQMTPLQARVGLVQLEKYDEIIDVRRKCASIYYNQLSDIPGLQLPPQVEGSTYSHFVVRAPYAKDCVNEMERKGIQLGEIIEYNVGDMAPYCKSPTGNYPIARQFIGQTINLPLGEIADAVKTSSFLRHFALSQLANRQATSTDLGGESPQPTR